MYKAVLISDIHFTVNTLEEASRSLTCARDAALHHKIPLIICGDTLDGKAMMRAECVNSLIDILKDSDPSKVLVLIGNHDLLNEKSLEHSLEFLRPYVTIIDSFKYDTDLDLWLFPYYSDSNKLKLDLQKVPTDSCIIMHQGVQGASMGHYAIDNSSLSNDNYKNYKVISGHYHKKQTITSGKHTFSYLGNPYTLSFSEANDGPKGYSLLDMNNNVTLIPINVRRHIIIERTFSNLYYPIENLNPDDQVILKVTGNKDKLDTVKKKDVADKVIGNMNFKLDLIPIKSESIKIQKIRDESDYDILDRLIDTELHDDSHKQYLKNLWRKL